jgi:hypothetical protein
VVEADMVALYPNSLAGRLSHTPPTGTPEEAA